MKIIVLHGEDTVKSYDRLQKFIESANIRSWEIIYVDEANLSIPEVLSGTSLFGNERFYVLRDIKKIIKKDFDWLNANASGISGNLTIYSENVIPATTIKLLPKDTKIEVYNLPKIIWSFLEHLYPGNSRTVLAEFHKIIETEPVEFIFSLIARHLRDLYWTGVDPVSTGFADWKIRKLKTQMSKFGAEKIKEIIGLLAEIDVMAKTGKADLVSSLDLLIVKYLK